MPLSRRQRLAQLLLIQRGHLFPWVPVCLAFGIGLYFMLPEEPGIALIGLAGLGAVTIGGLALRGGALIGPPFWLISLVAAGLVLGAVRAHMVAAPVLGFRYYGPVEGRIIGIDRSASDAVRLTLDNVRLDDVAPARTPDRVRISLHGDQGFTRLEPGRTILATAHLSPPGGPVEPGGFDFQRHAWFQGLGAIGYTRVPVLTLHPAQPGAVRVLSLRLTLASRIRAAMPDETGAFASAILTGDRSALPQPLIESLRQTNLAHLLAISGLHMGLVAGFVFAALRMIGAAIRPVALNWPLRSIAALAALAAATGYLVLSGAAIATERAYVMAAVALLALVVMRRAFSLRALALAALVVLILRPEALLSPGFQMSFAATTALVTVFGLLRGKGRGLPKPVAAVLTVILSSAVAGGATAPVGAAHFNTLSQYGLIANLLSVPLMGVLVMPAGVVALALTPFGLEAIPLWVMGWGLDWILLVAREVAAWPEAVRHVPAPGPAVLPLYAIGGLILVLWQGWLRWLGVLPLVAMIWLWAGAQRPDILIASRGELVGVLGPEGRALSKPRGAGFVASVWLENDGSAADQAIAAALWSGKGRVRHLTGKRAADSVTCTAGEVLVMTHDPPRDLPCAVYSPARLRDMGAVSLIRSEAGLKQQTAREVAGRRLWNTEDIRDRPFWPSNVQ